MALSVVFTGMNLGTALYSSLCGVLLTEYGMKTTALIAFLLDAISCVEGAGVQAEGVVNGLMHIGATLPAVVLLAMVVVRLTYDMDKRHGEYISRLEAKRAENAGGK